jgi:hypothetical protein
MKRIMLWGIRSGEVRQKDRRSSFSVLEREIDKQFEEAFHHPYVDSDRRISDAQWAATDAFPTPAPQPGNKPGYQSEATQE